MIGGIIRVSSGNQYAMGELVARRPSKNDGDRDESDSARACIAGSDLDVAVIFASCPALGFFPNFAETDDDENSQECCNGINPTRLQALGHDGLEYLLNKHVGVARRH